MVALTIGIVTMAAIQALIYWRQLRATKHIERAYIAIEPTHGGGIEIRRFNPESVTVFANFAAINRGQTPANVTDAALFIDFRRNEDALAPPPRYARTNSRTVAFLCRDDGVTFGANCELTNSEIDALDSVGGTHKLYAIGYVDYMDKFGRRHRRGFAAEYAQETHALRQKGAVSTRALLTCT